MENASTTSKNAFLEKTTRVGRRMHKFNRIRQVAPMCPHGRTRCCRLLNNIEPYVYAARRFMANYFDHLLSLDTLTCTVAHTAKRFEPSTVLWEFHTIQPSSLHLVFSASSVQHFSDLHPKFALRPHHVWKYGRHPISDS